MSLTDLLRMSLGNLKRRKLRTFLTVLGVVIGTASIVVMISLGLGMQRSMYAQVEQNGGLTTLTVTGQNEPGGAEDTENAEKYLTDDTVSQIGQMDHVQLAAPVYRMSPYLKKGKYIANIELVATTPEALEQMQIKLRPGGKLPTSGGKTLELVLGNGIPGMFYEEKTGRGFWDTGESPDFNLETDHFFLILNTSAYDSARYAVPSAGAEGGGDSGSQKPARKHVVQASGMVAGDENSYNPFFYNAYCDIGVLKQVLKSEFAGNAMPGQPSSKTGKPYHFFAYSSVMVKVTDLKYVDEVSTGLRSLGYQVESNIEYMESMKSQFAVVQAVLGGIGAVSLLVAAIGIANTMMMSIYERTKEIGVMKVLGCRLRNIGQMFLLEAAGIGFLGGVVGNILSFAISGIINLLTSGMNYNSTEAMGISYIPFWLVLGSLGFAVLVGMAAGYLPARRAMRLSPLAAIRNE